jgi:hypothetical protein
MRKAIVISVAAAATLLSVGIYLLKTGPTPGVDEALSELAHTPGDSLNSTSQSSESIKSDSGSTVSSSSSTMGSPQGTVKEDELPKGFGRIEPGQEKAYLKAQPLNAKELASVESFFRSFQLANGRAALNKLIKHLEAQGLEPLIAKDSNPVTGKMLTIRTSEALVGTKHFHANYLEDDSRNKDPLLQHLSFEIRGTADCMTKAEEILRKVYSMQLGEPLRRRGDEWVEWNVRDYNVSIYRLGLDDIRNDPVNARSLADIGNCKATIELIPEADHSNP